MHVNKLVSKISDYKLESVPEISGSIQFYNRKNICNRGKIFLKKLTHEKREYIISTDRKWSFNVKSLKKCKNILYHSNY